MVRILRLPKSRAFMRGSENDNIGVHSLDLLEKIGPQLILLLFPALCAFAIILTGESLIISDLAFIFGAILLIETVYFTYWSFTSDNSSVDSHGSTTKLYQGVVCKLECPECSKSFYVQLANAVENFECNHCQFTGEIENRDSILVN